MKTLIAITCPVVGYNPGNSREVTSGIYAELPAEPEGTIQLLNGAYYLVDKTGIQKPLDTSSELLFSKSTLTPPKDLTEQSILIFLQNFPPVIG